MRHRIVRAALGAAALLAVAAPMAPAANASACHPTFHAVCDAYGLACSHVPDRPKVNPHALLCEGFA
jgi:hypothetical protein